MIQVDVSAVYTKYREQTDAELSRLRHALAQAEAAVDQVVRERDAAVREAAELRAQAKRSATLPAGAEERRLPRVPDAPGAARP